jgi:hypothetical protein
MIGRLDGGIGRYPVNQVYGADSYRFPSPSSQSSRLLFREKLDFIENSLIIGRQF